MKILLTGFGSFLDVDKNISEVVLNNLNLELEVEKILLPVSYEKAYSELERKNNEFKPTLIIMMGVARKRKLISLESYGTNRISQELKDNDGMTPAQSQHEEALATRISLKNLYSELKNEHKSLVEISDSAGTYVCNNLYYKVLKNIQIPSLFIHLPPYEESWEIEEIVGKIIYKLSIGNFIVKQLP